MATTIANLLIKLEAETSGIQKGFSNVQKGALALGAAIAGIAKVSLDAFNVQDKAEKSLLTALKGREDLTNRLIRQAGEFQKVSLFGDEQIIQQQAFLASLQLTEDQINGVTAAAIDLAAGTGTSLDSAVRNLAKTYSGLTGELGESIPQLRELTAEQLKAGEAVDVVAKAFRGQAQAAAEAGTGPLVQLQNAFGDILEIVGEALGPAIQEVARILTDLAQRAADAAGGNGLAKIQAAFLASIEAAKIFVEGLRAAVGPLLAIIKGAQAASKALKGDFSGAADDARAALTELQRPFEFLFDLGENVSRVTDAYKSSLEDLTKATPDVVSGQQRVADSYKGVAADAGKATTAVKALAEQQARVVQQIGEIDTRALPTTVGERQTTGAGEVQESAGISGLENEILREKTSLLANLASTYTNLQGPLNEYIESLVSMEEKQAAINALQNAGNSALLEGADALTAYAKRGGSSLKEFANVALQSARKAVGAFIREGVAGAVSKALSGLPFPANIAAGAIAGALAQTLFNKLISNLKIPAFGDGGLVTGPTLALVGEKGPELITPLSQLGHGPLDVRVTGEIEGNKLKLLMDRYDQIGARKFT